MKITEIEEKVKNQDFIWTKDSTYNNRDFLHQKYIIEEMSRPEIVTFLKKNEIEVSKATIGRRLKEFGILLRSKSEAVKLLWKNQEFKAKLNMKDIEELNKIIPNLDLNIIYLFADQLKDWSRDFRNPKDTLQEIELN